MKSALTFDDKNQTAFLAQGTNLLLKFSYNNPPLDVLPLVADTTNNESVKRLINKQKKNGINKKFPHGFTWLSEATVYGNVSLVTWLLKKGALLTPDSEGRTPLHISASTVLIWPATSQKNQEKLEEEQKTRQESLEIGILLLNHAANKKTLNQLITARMSNSFPGITTAKDILTKTRDCTLSQEGRVLLEKIEEYEATLR